MREATIVRAWAGHRGAACPTRPRRRPSSSTRRRLPSVRLLDPRLPARSRRPARSWPSWSRPDRTNLADRRARHREGSRLEASARLPMPGWHDGAISFRAHTCCPDGPPPLAIVGRAAAIHFWAAGKLPPVICRATGISSAWPRCSRWRCCWCRGRGFAAVVLSLATLEAGFGLGTAYLYKVRLLEQTVFPSVEEAEAIVSVGTRCWRGARSLRRHRGRDASQRAGPTWARTHAAVARRQGDDRPVRRLDDLRRRRLQGGQARGDRLERMLRRRPFRGHQSRRAGLLDGRARGPDGFLRAHAWRRATLLDLLRRLERSQVQSRSQPRPGLCRFPSARPDR